MHYVMPIPRSCVVRHHCYRDCFMMPNYRSTKRGGTEFGNVRIMQLDDETTKKVDGLTYYAYTAGSAQAEPA